MESIYDYISEHLHSPETAIGLYNRLADSIETLDLFPERNQTFESPTESHRAMRIQRVENYSAVYMIQDDVVVVLRVLYSASDIRMRLLDE